MHHPVGVSSWLQQSDKTVGSIHKKNCSKKVMEEAYKTLGIN